MKLTVLSWLRDALIPFIGKIIELIFRGILFVMPLGVYLCLIQSRSKVSKISNITVFTKDESVWQHVFPGFILVAIEPDSFKKSVARTKASIQSWVLNNKYILSLLFMATIVLLMILNEVRR